ncbi:hypothetical protein MWU75_07110 [Ornithinimicrobium sp. F0845]|uniref:hypothetical protein n=1 Tax=Ornithinimicrobium sp. F0845 TaxID=2926412 RepID=UPI001FF313D9|nr:hypothetical protein [Ornithinimicrobium sp. F0845]MCK0111903.1 hypothetical protein [Ornithinimicrobium sp. F0845]
MADREPGPQVDRSPGWFREEAVAAMTSSRALLAGARDGIQELHDGITRAVRRLEDVDWAQRGGDWPPVEDRRLLLAEFADMCEAAARVGVGVEARLAGAQNGLRSARHAVEEWEPRTGADREEQARLHHTAMRMHRMLDEARMELERTGAALGRSAAAAREALPADRTTVEAVHVDLLQQALRAAGTEGHRVDEAVSRVSSQTRTAVLTGDDTSRAARERMRAHRDAPGGTHSPPSGIDR